MAYARVATFDGVTPEHLDGLRQRIEEDGQPEGMNATEFIFLHDPDSSKTVSIILFDSAEDYERGSAILDGVDRDDAPGQRTSVDRYEVAIRMVIEPSAEPGEPELATPELDSVEGFYSGPIVGPSA
jgi:hypothetical protein